MEAFLGSGRISLTILKAPSDLSQIARAGNVTPLGQRLLYGRKLGRGLKSSRRERLERLLPTLCFPLPDRAAALDPATCFDPPVARVWLELGFGAGEHLWALASRNPAVGFIGAEPFLGGVAALLARFEAKPLPNLKLFPDDARLLLKALTEASIERLFVLFPDPWPKRRHHRRRLIGPSTIADMARALTNGGELRLATDHGEFARWALAHILAAPAFDWLAERAADWRAPGPDWPGTRYQAKAIRAGRRCLFFRFRRRDRRLG
jgi:tRNA (guanine-N7-)-methyltransferase